MTENSFVIAEITITLTSTSDGDIQHGVSVEGEPTLLQQLGSLEMAKDSIIRMATGSGDEDES